MENKNYIKAIRTHLGFTIDETARRLDISKSTWQKWEYGASTPPKYLIKALMWLALEVSLANQNKHLAAFVLKNILEENGWDELGIIMMADMLQAACFKQSGDKTRNSQDLITTVRTVWENKNSQ